MYKFIKMAKNKNMKKFFIGVISGIISGLFSSGGGLILLPCLTHIFNQNEKEARANTLICILIMVITSCFFYMKLPKENIDILIKLILSGITGCFIGSKVLKNIKTKYLSIFYIGLLIYSGVRFLR